MKKPRRLFAALLILLLQACAELPRHPVPADLVNDVSVLDIKNVRFRPEMANPDLGKKIDFWYRQQLASGVTRSSGESPDANCLALSGGGEDGAFGAGLLVGWSQAGTRPEFLVVTGVSTGALMAPFAFLGPKYDATLRKLYTEVTTDDIAIKENIFTILGGDSVYQTRPLARLLNKYITQELLDEVAREYKRGRRLFIGTTELDTGHPFIWNMGEIASSRSSEALQLFRDVMRASSAIPVAFPPVLIKVESEGKHFDEMHVDGGTTSQVFFFPTASVDLKKVETEHHVKRRVRLYVIRNARLEVDWQDVHPTLSSIGGRSVSLLIGNQGVGDLFRIHQVTKNAGVEFNLAVIPMNFTKVPLEMFDRTYMNELFNFSFELSRNGFPWNSGMPSWIETLTHESD